MNPIKLCVCVCVCILTFFSSYILTYQQVQRQGGLCLRENKVCQMIQVGIFNEIYGIQTQNIINLKFNDIWFWSRHCTPASFSQVVEYELLIIVSIVSSSRKHLNSSGKC